MGLVRSAEGAVRLQFPGYTDRVLRFFVPLALALAACPRPPLGPPNVEPPGAGRVGPLALEAFTQDRPAIAGKWFDYEPEGHALTPKEQAWIVRDVSDSGIDGAVRYAAFRIASIYEPDSADSGRFTLTVALHDGTAWGAEQEWLTPRNVKSTGQLCVSLFEQSELPCGEADAWQLRLAVFQYFSPLAGIAVAEPGVFLHSARTSAARIDDVTTLASLPEPATLAELADGPPAGWQSTDWAFTALAPDLPEAGMAIGARFVDVTPEGVVGRDDVYWLLASRFDLVRFTVRPAPAAQDGAGDALRFTFATVEADREDWSVPQAQPEPRTVDVAVPASGSGTWLSFATSDLLLADEHLADTTWPHAPPKTTRFDIAIESIATAQAGVGELRLLVSPAACIHNATQLGLNDNVPPVSTP